MYITAYEGCETAQRPFSAKLRLTCKPIPMATFRCTRSLILRAAPALCQLQISSVGTLASTMLPRAQDLPSSSHGTILPPSITSSVKRCFSLDAVQAYLVGLSSSQDMEAGRWGDGRGPAAALQSQVADKKVQISEITPISL